MMSLQTMLTAEKLVHIAILQDDKALAHVLLTSAETEKLIAALAKLSTMATNEVPKHQ